VLFAVPVPGANLSLAEVRSFVSGRLASYKAPDVLIEVEQLPVTPIGKVDKRQLQPQAAEEAATWTR